MSKTFPTIKIVQRDYTRKDGSHNIFLRLTIKRKIKYYPLNIFVNPKWFKSGHEDPISKSDPEYKEKNILINHYHIKTKKILFNYQINDKTLTFGRFEKDFTDGSIGSKSFYDFTSQQISLLKEILAPNTIRNHESQLKKLKEFRSELNFEDIDLDFITGYVGYIKQKKSNNPNTIIKSVKVIKTYLNRAVDQGLIKENPIKKYKLGKIEGNREFLSQSELEILEKLYYKNSLKPNKANVLKYFLFCCYTGLRYEDIKRLKFKDIIDNKRISIQMAKTKEPVVIPLIDRAKSLIPDNGFDSQPVFKVLTNQVSNRHLKDIIEGANISKKITMHCARHTFATIAKSHGIDYDAISKYLGHTDIKTTKIYAKYELDYLEKEMEKWDKTNSVQSLLC